MPIGISKYFARLFPSPWNKIQTRVSQAWGQMYYQVKMACKPRIPYCPSTEEHQTTRQQQHLELTMHESDQRPVHPMFGDDATEW